MTEQVANFGATTLAEALDTTETGVDVTSGAVFPSSGDFRINIDDELMLVTARSGNTLTVTRNIEGTSAATHSNGAAVKMVLTAAGLIRIIDGVIGSMLVDTSVSGAHTADRDVAATHDLTLTGNATITPDHTAPVSGEAIDLRLLIRQDGTGGRTLAWGGSITWGGGASPSMPTTANALLAVGLLSVDDGVTWLGYAIEATMLDDLTDVTITAAASGDFLRYSGSAWVDSVIQASDIKDVGRYEVIVSGTAPPVAVTNEAEDDWLYGWVSG